MSRKAQCDGHYVRSIKIQRRERYNFSRRNRRHFSVADD
ncbi:unnamed protein product [Gulo gulo]|uniref:Uncharacterized protein n=1 Tax=Gulo gulo TaxID=48420 RepID=A0A9X9LH29_GULGU|nr:unnamed protein product [Gulo gulo]